MDTENQIESAPLNGAPKPEQMVPYFDLFRYATKSDKTLMWIGAFAAFANGVAFPSFSLIFGGMTDSFSQSGDEMVTEAGMNAIYFLIVGAGTMLCSFIMFATWMITGEQQGIEFRKHYFRAILKQEIGWFDTINPNELNSKVANESFAVQGAIGEKMPTFIMTFSMTFFGFLIGYIKGWQLALVITATLPAMSIVTGGFAMVIQNSELATQKAYSNAGALAEQAINSVKTVKMLDGEEFECVNYSKCLLEAAKISLKYNFGVGLGLGLLFGFMIWSYALGFWYGAKLIADQTVNDNTGDIYSAGDVLVIFFAILTGGFSLGQAGPCVQNFAKGQAAAVKMFAVLDRKPKIINPIAPKSLNGLSGEIVLKDVHFNYPNRPETKILNGINLVIQAGKKVALVGESGCGKSTVMQLIERFYDCDQGQVLFGGQDGIDVRDVLIKELRGKIGMVGQEPVLFATTIRENLLYGNPEATEEQMIEALKKVNAWNFISRMEKKLETYVGIGGGQLSGGQKQRIAIARAILKNPQILLLDEATSALDRTNEKLIQKTLDEVSIGITTIVIAHRLTTIQNADLIYVIEGGQVVEQGNFNELMQRKGKFAALAKNQTQAEQQEDVKEIQEEEENYENYGQQQDYSPDTKKLQGSQKSIKINLNPLDNPNILENAKSEIEKFKQLEVPQLIKKVSSQGHHPSQVKNVNQVGIETESKGKGKPEEVDAQLGRLFNYNKDERLYFIIGIIGALANGCVFPIFSMFLSEIITILVESNPIFYTGEEYESKKGQVQDDANRIALWFFIMGSCAVICWIIQTFFLSICGERLTLKLRTETYRKLLKMPIPFFDVPQNNAGTLTSRLSVDCKLIQGLTSTIIGINLSNIGSLICGLVIAFYSSWALTLIVLAMSPLAYLGGILQAQFMQGFSDLTDEAYKDSGNLIMEAVTNIRTVVSFGNEDIILGIYSKKVQLPLEKAKKRGVYAGLAFGFSQMQMFLINAIVFFVGAVLVRDTGLTIQDMFTSILAITFATMGAGNNAAFAGDIGASKNASKNIFAILDQEDEFQREQRTGKKQLKTQIIGNIDIKGISFHYPSREKHVFDDMSLIIPAGQKVSFVGPSGCGKSTIMQMLMRFYDPDQGQILLDGIDITDYDIRYLRRTLAIVSQEPVLFSGTIKENIEYNMKDVSMDQIIEATKKANAYDFITQNQFEEVQALDAAVVQKIGQGFDRFVGPKGSQISGGQKQRIAIARALLRNSQVLLLDEATSALDSASEALVQESLNKAMEGKTSLAIAHRISTIKDSNIIYVFEEGKIVEQGTYNYLVGLKGSFYRLEQGIAH